MLRVVKQALRTISIGQLTLILSGVIVVFAAVMVLLMSTFIERQAITDLAQDEAREKSELIFQALYSAMRKGWDKEEIHETILRLNEAQPGTTIRLFRSQQVIDQYGTVPEEEVQKRGDAALAAVLRDGREALIQDSDRLRYLYPVMVKTECLSCHAVQPGTVNGVVDITFPIVDLKVSLGYVIRSVIVYFAIVLVALCLIVYFKLRYFVAFPISRFVRLIEEIIEHTDLSRRLEGRSSRLTEIQRLSDHFNRLLGTIEDYHDRLRTYSERDPLTGTWNRHKFEGFLKVEVDRGLRHGHTFSLLLMDLDNFKHINDTYGHPIGDLVLKELTAVLHNRLRRTDVLSRLGGDEFAILLPDTPLDQAFRMAESLRQELGETMIHLPVGNTRIQASFGLVTFPDNGADVEKLSIAMEVSMYKAKKLGKNCIATIDGDEEGIVMEVFNRGQQVQRALAEDRVIPFFQPICATSDGQPYAYEVLARIRDGELLLSAGEFIETAEELGMARAIDEAVFRKGLLEAARHTAYHGKLFFNLSARTIGDGAWMRGIPDLIRASGIDPKRVVLEITEREALPNFDNLIQLMADLRKDGVVFALDDFGSGFSSFLYLKYLHVDYVKIEGSFVRHMARDSRDRVMVAHIHGMAHEFGLKTIAEFVEDAETGKLLHDMGVDFAQGYHYGRPDFAPADGGRRG